MRRHVAGEYAQVATRRLTSTKPANDRARSRAERRDARVWDDASHALPIQHPRAVNEALLAHLADAC